MLKLPALLTWPRVREAAKGLSRGEWRHWGKGFLYGSGLITIAKGKEFVALPILLSLLGVAAYGEYIQIVLIGSVLSIFVLCGMDVALVRYLHRNENPQRELAIVYTVMALTGCVVAIAWLAAGRHVLGLFDLPTEALVWGSFIAGIEAVRAMSLCYYRALERYERIALFFVSIDVLEIFVLFTVLLIAERAPLGLVMWIYVGIRSVPAILPLVDMWPDFSEFRSDQLKARIRFGLSLLPKEFVLWAGHSADRFVISYFLGPAVTGTYSAAYKLASIVKIVSQPVTFISFQNLARLWDRGDRAQFSRAYRLSLGAYLLLVSPVLVVFAFGAELILGLISAELVGNGVVLLLVAVGMLFHTLQGISSYYVYLFAGRVAEYTLWISLCFMAGLVAQYLLIRSHGLLGAAVGSLLTYLVFWLLITFSAGRILKGAFHERGQLVQ